MKKQELIDELKGKDFVLDIESIEGGDVIHKNLKIKTYAVNVFEVVGKVAIGRTITIYVKDEGSPEEAAYYKDSEPKQMINRAEG
jgi:hypothetical protein